MPSTNNDKVLIIDQNEAAIKKTSKLLLTAPKSKLFKKARVVETDSTRCFKIYIVLCMISIWATHTLLVRYTRSIVPVKQVLLFTR